MLIVFCLFYLLNCDSVLCEKDNFNGDWRSWRRDWRTLANSISVENSHCPSDRNIKKMSSTALLLGATGETGKELLKQLAASPHISKIVTVGRRVVDLGEGMDKVEQKVIDFDNIDQHAEQFKQVDKAFCCLGTTRAKSGKEGFIKVDYTYVLKSAELLKAGGCNEFHLLTSKGSNKDSWFLYPSTKGKVEEAVKGLGFTKLGIYRPSLLITPGGREEKRMGEGWLQSLANWIDKSHSWSVPVSIVARAMLLASDNSSSGVTLLEHHEIVELANKQP